MPRLVSAPFFSAHPVFDRAEYATAVGRDPSDKVVTAMLAQHLQAGNIKRLARGVFASVPRHADARKWSVDRFLAASRLRRGGVIAYHSALELHGFAYTEGYEVQVIAPGEPGVLEAAGFSCRFIRPRRGFTRQDGELQDGVMVVDRMGLDVRVTTVERTIADLFDRYELAGGREELFNSLDLVARIDAAALVRYMRTIGNAAAAGALGYWLERHQSRLGVPETALNALHAMAPRQARYTLGAKPGEGRTAKGWNVILPLDVVERPFEGL
ncbi:hypothetical protein [Methylacidimicrobium sp. B4]|uniref:type IV toxin-antitoxin system AbiEi family antitoxin domain-containing protein n=1 Tax=Methylacidimicrobium sp. B4 TaxID=2796139 RepID=UPI001A8F5E2E|nr:hypothetical protein [Methylacidimicrobium sp. B4]QSR84169.1 hypothetical protein MacB4_07950 [Methylacidimicrobium sp. B4]